MRFKISNKIIEKYRSLIEAVVILKNIDNTTNGNGILKLLREEENNVRKKLSKENLANHPKIKVWREAFKQFGSKPNKFSSSIEALLKRVLKGDNLPDINPLVNLYNYCSIKHMLPFGGEDFKGVYGDMELKYCKGNEDFIPILSNVNEPPDNGEVSWCDDKGVTCRKWNWRQCDRTKITNDTKEGYFIIDALPPSTKDTAEKAVNEFIELAKKYLNADGEILWLDKSNLTSDVDIKTKSINNNIQKFSSNKNKLQKSQKPYHRMDKKRKTNKFKNHINKLAARELIGYKIRDLLWEAIKICKYDKYISKDEIIITHPQDESFGDFSSNFSFKISKKIKKDPIEIIMEIIDTIKQDHKIKSKFSGTSYWPESMKAVNGFMNITLSKDFYINELEKIIKQKNKYGYLSVKDNFKLIVEFGQPNTHKMPHIGHLFSYIVGESIARTSETLGFDVFRANYQGDVGPHVAKCLWSLKKYKGKIPDSYRAKADLLQLMYQKGSSAYEKDKVSKDEIDDVNKMIYAKDKSVYGLWKKSRSWSVNFYKEFENKLGILFDRHYFESEVAPIGKKIVEDNIGKIFKKSKGAIIFEGSKYGLHDRVFITSKGTPTYEAKDMGLQTLKYQEHPFDYMIITTASEQNAYFQVIIKALKLFDKKYIGKLEHFGFSMVNLKTGKMSSRKGNIVTGLSLVENAIKEIYKIIKDKKIFSEPEKKDISEIVGISAIKYSFLKSNPLQNITFSFDESISFEGNSGPYLQYTYARARSILKKQKEYNLETFDKLGNSEEVSILRTLYRFPEIVIEAGKNLSPHILCTYLFELAQKFNLFYKKHKVINAKDKKVKDARLALTEAVSIILENGLNLLGIDVLEKM